MEEGVKRYLFESFREKYHRAGKEEKGTMLEGMCEALGCHRKHAIRLLRRRRPGKKPAGRRRGPKSKYNTPEFMRALHRVRKVMEFRSSKVMKANMPEWLPFIEKHYGVFEDDVRDKLLKISAATIDRYLKNLREQGGHGLATTRPGTILRNEIPIQTASMWDETTPGRMATDTVAHCGSTTEGQYVNSLDMVDPVTHWCAQRAVWGKGQAGVLDETKDIEQSLPFPLIGLHVDNGTEFINHHFIRYFTQLPERRNFRFTRSRPHEKNDNTYVEQKNWSVVRRYFGYDRFEFQELVLPMNDLYKNELCLYLNHFCPTFKLDQKIAMKSRYKRIYGDPVTPYARVIASTHVPEDTKRHLKKVHGELDPVALKLEIEQKLKKFFATLRRLKMLRHSTSAA